MRASTAVQRLEAHSRFGVLGDGRSSPNRQDIGSASRSDQWEVSPAVIAAKRRIEGARGHGRRASGGRLREGWVTAFGWVTRGASRDAAVLLRRAPERASRSYLPLGRTPLTAPALELSSPTERTAPNTGRRRRTFERAEASASGVDAGAIPAGPRGGVRARFTVHRATATTQVAAVPSRSLGASTTPVSSVAPFSASRLPGFLAVKENAR